MSPQRPEIFTLISCPTIGELGPDTKIVETDPCPVCGQEYRRVFVLLDYQLDVWERAELIRVAGAYAMTRRLFTAFEQAGLKGGTAHPMKTSRGELFEAFDPGRKVVVPEFVHFWIDDEVDGPSGWWDRGPVCRVCERVIWEPTERISEALFAKYSGEAGPPRLVSAGAWTGSDIFMLTDPGPPVVTERFKRFTEAQNVAELVFAPAQWVD